MAEETSQEKTEEPTQRRIEKFREEGNISISRDVAGVAILAAALLVLTFHGGTIWTILSGGVGHSFRSMAEAGHTDGGLLVTRVMVHGMQTAALAVAALCGTAMLMGTAAGLAQTGGNWSGKAMGFKFERLSLLKGIKRSLASVEALQQIGMALGKAIVLGTALFVVLKLALPELVGLAHLELRPGVMWLLGLLARLVMAALVASAALALVDYMLVRRRMHEQMKMTKQEVKDEIKQQEGDPLLRARLKQRMREIGRNQMIAATREADMVVVNPTHYAVAIKYRIGQEGAPVLVSKGKDAIAARIRKIARRNQIPIIANPPVARAVFAGARVGQEIPGDLYEMVARVLAYLYRMAGRRAAA